MRRPAVDLVGPKTYMIDSGFLGIPHLAAVYYLDAERPALVETSGALVARNLIDRLRASGVDDLAYVVVSHVHLDHAGAAGHILEAYPGARLVVHPAGARHMADPERLHRSAERVYGEKAMREEWGYLRPVPPDSIVTAEDGQVLDLGDRRLQILFTPGHAKHHLSVWDASEGAVYLGDSAGVYVSEAEYQAPSAPPPDLDPVVACRSLERIEGLGPEVIYFTHFGPARETGRLLENARRQYLDWLQIAEDGFEQGYDTPVVADLLESEADPGRKNLAPHLMEKVNRLVPYRVQAEGYLTYLRRRRAH